MHIDHKLWPGSMLAMQAKFLPKERMGEEVRAYIRGKRRCDDLTGAEKSFNEKLAAWLEENNLGAA